MNLNIFIEFLKDQYLFLIFMKYLVSLPNFSRLTINFLEEFEKDKNKIFLTLLIYVGLHTTLGVPGLKYATS